MVYCHVEIRNLKRHLVQVHKIEDPQEALKTLAQHQQGQEVERPPKKKMLSVRQSSQASGRPSGESSPAEKGLSQI